MVPEVKKILTEVEDDVAKNITLKIQTNGTIEPDKNWIEIFKKFKIFQKSIKQFVFFRKSCFPK